MGLDMYLKAKTTTANNEYYQKNPEVFDEVLQTLELTPDQLDPEMLSMTISIPVVYWRKENAIHAWFVKNAQDGNDNCAEYWVSRERLQELVKTCKQVLADKNLAHSLLPTTEGFFFGTTQYDQYYFDGLKKTQDRIEKYLRSPQFNDYDFYYQSSW
jgi:hypothetical protein